MLKAQTGGSFSSSVGAARILMQGGVPMIFPPSGFFANNGVFVIGQAPSAAATVSFSATSGSVTMTFSAATLLGTAADVGRILTILDTTYKYATITTQSSTTVATATISGGTLSSTGPFANNAIWLSGTPTTNTTAFSVPLPTVYANAYGYFPANAIVAGSAAGEYLVQMASTTQGVAFNNVYVSGTPTIPASPTAFVTTGPGAYTQTTGALQSLSVPLGAGAMGTNGKFILEWMQTANNSAGNKFVVWQLGSSGNLVSTLLTTGVAIGAYVRCTNKGVQNSQTSGAGASGSIGSQGSAVFRTTIDTSIAQNILLLSNIATASDYNIIEDVSLALYPN